MPYQIVKRKDGFYVYKEDEKGRITGDAKNKDPYASKKDALPYLRALYAAESDEISELSKEAFDAKRDDVYSRYHALVNMSASALENWADTDASKRASLDRSPIARNLRLLRKAKAEWTGKDIADANRTISFISRMRRMPKGEPVNQDIPYSKRDISLKNWAYNPVSEMTLEEVVAEMEQYAQADVQYVNPSPHENMRCANCAFWRDGRCVAVRNEPEAIAETGYCEHWQTVDDEDDMGDDDMPDEAPVTETTFQEERTVVRESAQFTEFKGNVPNIPEDGVDKQTLTEGDPNPVFVTLRLARIGEVSKNGLLYDEAFVSAIEEQIKGKGGIFGHIKDEDRATAFPIPAGIWTGAKRVGDTLWGKAYIRDRQAAEYVRQLKATGGGLGTSVYGAAKAVDVRPGVRRLEAFVLEQVDFAPPERASLDMGGYFEITREMTNPEERETDMSDVKLTPELVMEQLDETSLEQLVEMYMKKKGKKVVAAEFAAKADRQETVISELNTQTSQQARELAALRTRVAEFENREYESALDAVIANDFAPNTTSADHQKLVNAYRASLRRAVVSEIGERKNIEYATALVKEIGTRDEFMVQKSAYLAQIAGSAARTGTESVNDPVKARIQAGQDLLARMGVSIKGE